MAEMPGRSIAVALEWVGKIFAVVLVMCLPGLGGTWLDRRLGTSYLGGVGFVFGLVLGLWSLIAMTRAAEAARRAKRDSANWKDGANGNNSSNDSGNR